MKYREHLIVCLRLLISRGGLGFLVLIGTAVMACADEPLRIMVSIPPQKEIVERIAGPDACVSVMLPPGKNPETYSPLPSQIRQLGEAQVYFSIGVPFEKRFLPNIDESMPGLLVADMSQGIERRALEGHHHDGEEAHEDGDAHEHEHEGGEPDPHVWLAPLLLALQADQAASVLAGICPERAREFQDAAATFRQEMETLDAQLKDMLAPFAGHTVFVYHPAFGYFTDAYGLTQEAIEQGGSSPTPKQIAQLIASARADNVHVIFVQPEFDQGKAEVIAQAIQGKVAPLNPLDEQVTKNLLLIGESIRDALQRGADERTH